MLKRSLLPCLLVFTGVLLPNAASLQAQDVEMLGRMYGTTPPASYFELMAKDPTAFQFERAWKNRLEEAMLERSLVPAVGSFFSTSGNPFSALRTVPGAGSVQGNIAFPVVLGLYSDSPADPPYTMPEVRTEFFVGPNSRFQTIPELYSEMSGGRVTLEGVTYDWLRAGLTQEETTGNVSGLGSPSRVRDFIKSLVQQLDDAGIDWGQFDNDGADGIPNSGDDDGFVDVLAVIHVTRGAECDRDRKSNRIWSHRSRLSSATGSSFTTRTPRANGGFIRINDYTIQPVLSCDNTNINEIGVFAHELGHGFGLPDLYSTTPPPDTTHAGAGGWDLMASGSWGCRGGGQPERPCHMGAWSKAMLGWLDLEVLQPGVDHGVLTLDPVQTTGQAYMVESGDGSGQFFLLENRQQIGFDAFLRAPGLLVWHIDPAVILARRGSNTINRDPNRMGVWLRQADGLNHLGTRGGGRGDAGDPFPGATNNTAFHAGSNPASRTHAGAPTGVTLLDITESNQQVSFRLLTRFSELTLQAQGMDATGATNVFTVDGIELPGLEASFLSAPFDEHEIATVAGVEEEEGVRRGFESWSDGEARVRTFRTGLTDSLLVARFSGRQYRVQLALAGGVGDIAPGAITSNLPADGWITEGEPLQAEAAARTGFAFREWSGALAGQPNPATFAVTAPLSAAAEFDVAYRFAAASSLSIEAAVPQQIAFQTENANLPVAWSVSGTLPAGLTLNPIAGEIRGFALETGSFPVTIRGRDAIGLDAELQLTMTVSPPVIGLDDLVGPFLLGSGTPTEQQRHYLDRNGNSNGQYDLGDLRAHLIANPGLPMTARMTEAVRTLITLPPVNDGANR